MRLGQIALATAAFALCAAVGAKATPPVAPLSGAAVETRIDAEPVRWRHGHRRDYFWNHGRPDVGSLDDANPFTIFGATRPSVPEILRRDVRRRGRWVDPPPE